MNPVVPRRSADGMPATELPELLSVADVARVLGVSRKTVYRLVAAGDLNAVQVGGLLRFTPDAVRALIGREAPPSEAA